jgi:hypothetical protein
MLQTQHLMKQKNVLKGITSLHAFVENEQWNVGRM